MHLLNKHHAEFNVYASTVSHPADEIDSTRLISRYIRGSGGVAIFWRKTLDNLVSKLPPFTNNMVAAIKLSTTEPSICFLACYLPSRAGPTDPFKDSLDYLDSSLTNYGDSIPVILGDLNADPGQSGGPLATTPPNEQGKILLRYLTRWNFVSTHLNTPASVGNSSHTYASEAHHSSSTINHILCLKHFQSNLSHCRVYDENPLNLSDHLQVVGGLFCRLSMLTNISSPSFIAPKPNWSRLNSSEIADTYTVQVQSALSSLSFPDASFSSLCPSDIDSHLQNIVEILSSAAADTISSKKFLPHLKPGWNSSLSKAHRESKLRYRAWVKAGRPRDPLNQYRSAYKCAKTHFRKILRLHEAEQRDSFLLKLDLSLYDLAKVFCLIRKVNGQLSVTTNTLVYQGSVHQGDAISLMLGPTTCSGCSLL